MEDKKREQAYQDQLRTLEIERLKAELQQAQAKAGRANDYIDSDLKRQNAQTDVVQSDADAKRAISNGTKSLLEGVGDGAAKRRSGFFSR